MTDGLIAAEYGNKRGLPVKGSKDMKELVGGIMHSSTGGSLH